MNLEKLNLPETSSISFILNFEIYTIPDDFHEVVLICKNGKVYVDLYSYNNDGYNHELATFSLDERDNVDLKAIDYALRSFELYNGFNIDSAIEAFLGEYKL